MATESTRQQPSGLGTITWAVFFFFIFALILWIWVRTAGSTVSYEDKRGEERAKIKEEVVKAATDKLNTAAVVDQAKGTARIAIADAKQLVIADLKAKKVGASAVKVDPWLPMPPPADPNSKEPPTPALSSAPQGADTIRFETAPSK